MILAVSGLLAGCAASAGPASSGSGAAGSSDVARVAAPAAAPIVVHEVARTSTLTDAPATPNACASNRLSQFVLVDISDQHVWMCAGTTTVYSSPVTTGTTYNDDDTPTGTFHVEGKQQNRTLHLLDGSTYFVHYWVPFSGTLYGFHDASWQTVPFGTDDYHRDGSHGCVHLPMAAMDWLYRWAAVGTTVTVRP